MDGKPTAHPLFPHFFEPINGEKTAKNGGGLESLEWTPPSGEKLRKIR
jgi:hypothetical protein